MAEAAVWFFYVHTAMCGIFICMVGAWAFSRLNGRRAERLVPVSVGARSGPSAGARALGDEAFLQGMGYVTLGLYLMYAEVYLYRVYSFLQP